MQRFKIKYVIWISIVSFSIIVSFQHNLKELMLPHQLLTAPLFQHCMTKSTHFHLLTPSPFISSGQIANPLFLISPPTIRGGEYQDKHCVVISNIFVILGPYVFTLKNSTRLVTPLACVFSPPLEHGFYSRCCALFAHGEYIFSIQLEFSTVIVSAQFYFNMASDSEGSELNFVVSDEDSEEVYFEEYSNCIFGSWKNSANIRGIAASGRMHVLIDRLEEYDEIGSTWNKLSDQFTFQHLEEKSHGLFYTE